MHQATFGQFCAFIDTCAAIKPLKAGEGPRGRQPQILNIFESYVRHIEPALDYEPRIGSIVFRLLFPEKDVRRRYGLKEKLLSSMLIKIYALTLIAAIPVQMWDVTAEDGREFKSGCLGLELANVIALRADDNIKDLTLVELDEQLDKLASFSEYSVASLQALKPRKGSKDTQQSLYRKLYRGLTPRQAAILTQIILKDLRPILYPMPAVSTSIALLKYNSNAFHELQCWEAIKRWHWAMEPVYNVRADLDRAADAVALLPRRKPNDLAEHRWWFDQFCVPEHGVPVEIPKAIKGQGIDVALRYYAKNRVDVVSVETKYDGERMQIHYDADRPYDQQITIISKSKRDSTIDRVKAHSIIRAALNLYWQHSPCPKPIDQHLIERLGKSPYRSDHIEVRSIMIEAEMCAFNEIYGRLDEFWRIDQAKKGNYKVPTRDESQHSTQSSQTSTIASDGTVLPPEIALHLVLVFFDVIMLNGESLIRTPYADRVKLLDKVVRPIEGYSLVAKRTQVDLTTTPYPMAVQQLQRLFTEATEENKEEGLFLKAASSRYNDWRHGMRWTKLKADYIPGLGDTASFIIVGASHDADRGRMLGVGCNVLTTFYIGLLQNERAISQDPSAKPDYVVFWTVSWGLSRAQLEYLNFYVQQNVHVSYEAMVKAPRTWPFKLTVLPGGVKAPRRVFRKPMVFEIKGAGWTKQGPQSRYYELRWPRITKVHYTGRKPHDKEVTFRISASEALARKCVSVEVSEASKDISAIWADQSDFVPALLSDDLRAVREKRLAVFGSPKTTKRPLSARDEQADLFSPGSPDQPKTEIASTGHKRKRSRVEAASPKPIRCPSPIRSPRQPTRPKHIQEAVVARVLTFDQPTPATSSEATSSAARELTRALKPPGAVVTAQNLPANHFEDSRGDIFYVEVPIPPSCFWWIPRQFDPTGVRRTYKFAKGRLQGPAVFNAAGWRDRRQRRQKPAVSPQPGFIFVDPSKLRKVDEEMAQHTAGLRKGRSTQPVYVYDIAVLGLPKCFSVEQIPQPLRVL